MLVCETKPSGGGSMLRARLSLSFIFFFFVLSFSAYAADRTALVGGRLIDGFGHRPLANSVILVADGIIKEVGHSHRPEEIRRGLEIGTVTFGRLL